MFGGSNGGFTGLGQGQRMTGHMDIWSELWIPVIQAFAYSIVAGPVIVITILIDVFILQPDGLSFVVCALSVLVAFVAIAGGQFTIWLPVIGEREINIPSIRTRNGIIIIASIVSVFLFVWNWNMNGYNLLFYLWDGFWPTIKILWWELCLACINVPMWAVLLIVPSSIGLFRAVGLLGFRLRYEIVDPMWPPTIQQRSPMTGPFGPEWSPFVREDEQPQPVVAQTKNGKNNKSWSFYTPPTGVTMKQVYFTCVAIEQTEFQGIYTWPGEGNIERVGQKPHRALQDHWEHLGYCKKGCDNVYVLTDKGIVIMKKVIEEGI